MSADAHSEQTPQRQRFAIEATGLKKSFGTVPVLKSIDLKVQAGSVFALLGPNGAGKTTIVRILSTLASADGGQATVAGFDVATQRHQVRRSISLTGQYAAIDELQTGKETLAMMGRLWGFTHSMARVRADELLEQFDLMDAGGRQVRSYSGGMRRRLDLAASLVGHPEVIFLDEPTTGLDIRSRQAMWDVISRLAAGGATIFLTTQYLEEADQLADYIALIDDGRVAAEGTADQLKNRIGTLRLDLTFANADSFETARRSLGTRVIVSDTERLIIGVETDGTAAHVRALLDEIDPRKDAVRLFEVHSPTLDDVFLALTGHGTATAAKEATHV